MERKVPNQKRLVGNDIVTLRRSKTRPAKSKKPPKVISDVRVTKKKPYANFTDTAKTQASVGENTSSRMPTTPTPITQTVNDEKDNLNTVNQAFVNAIAYDTFIIVVLAYIGFISKWLIVFIVAYAIIVVFFRFNSRRMFISAALSIISLIVLKFLHKTVLESVFLKLSLFYVTIAIICLGIEFVRKKYLTKRN